MKIKLVFSALFICVILILSTFSIFNSKEVYASSEQTITLTYMNKIYKYTKPIYNNFYFESVKQQNDLKIKQVGLRQFLINLKASGLSTLDALDYAFPNFKNFYNNICVEIEQPMKDCNITFNPSNNSWSFSLEQVGKQINLNSIFLAICSGSKNIKINLDETLPTYTKKELESNFNLRSKQYTSFANSDSGRKFNVTKAIECFNGLIVKKGETISFQNIINKNDKGTPYKEATIIVNGEFVKGIGGGICQASTTIYNAVLMAGLDIVEVHNHTLPVGYVERGFDATVNDTNLDLKFKNNTNHPIYIKTYTNNSCAYAEVYGEQMEYNFEKVSEEIEKIEPPPPLIISDINNEYNLTYKGEYYTKRYAQFGYKIKAYLNIYKNGKLIEKKLIRCNTYNPTQSIIYEGVKEKEAN